METAAARIASKAATSRWARATTELGRTPATPPQSGLQSEERSQSQGMASITAPAGWHPRRSPRCYSDAARRKSVQVPRDGTFLQIKSVFDIYKQVRMLVGMVGNVWNYSCSTVTLFRQVLPGLARVHVGNEVYTVPGYLLQELDTITERSRSFSSTLLQHTSVTDPSVQDVRVRHPCAYFKHILLLLKLRWLLRLHSACCELDYKVLSLKNLILGIQYVVLQQHEEVECDSIFDTKVSQHIGSHLNLESVFDDIVDQLQRALGGAWRGFLEYVGSCDPARSLYMSKMDGRNAAPRIVPNDSLSVVIDTIFVANFLRQSRKQGPCRLPHLYAELEMLGLQIPEVPPLHAAQHLRAWALAQSKPTLQDRTKAGSKDSEKLAQLDAVLLAAAIELHSPEVMAAPEEITEATVNEAVSGQFHEAPKTLGFDKTDNSGPPAARVILEDKPQLSLVIFEAVVDCIRHHDTFPDGIRERLYQILNEEYGLTREQVQRLAIGATQNIDGKRLSDATLLGMEEREKTRLRQYEVDTNRSTAHLLVPPLVQAPIEKGKRAKYTLTPVTAARPVHSLELSRSTPNLSRASTNSYLDSREPFKVPLSTGPLTFDPETKKLRTTGLFIKMPPLKGGP